MYSIETDEMYVSGNHHVECCWQSFQQLPQETSCFHGYGAVVLEVQTEISMLLGGRQPPRFGLWTKRNYLFLSLCCGTKGQ